MITTMFILTATAGMLALMAISYARAHPRLAFANAKSLSFNLNKPSNANVRVTALLFRSSGSIEHIIGEPMTAPSWPGYLPIPLRVTNVANKDEGKTVDDAAGEDPDGDVLKMKSRDKVRERVYADCLDSFEACRDRSRALALKVDLLSRYPGHRSEIRRAFREVYDS